MQAIYFSASFLAFCHLQKESSKDDGISAMQQLTTYLADRGGLLLWVADRGIFPSSFWDEIVDSDDKNNMGSFLRGLLCLRDSKGRTALHAAAALGDCHMIRYLVKEGCDMTIVNNNGHLATEIWTDSAHLSSETVETLFHANCPRSSPTIDAVEKNCLSSALEIMKSELAVNHCIFRNGQITSVLSTAVSIGTLEMLDALLKGIKEVVEVVVDVQLPDTKCGLNHLTVHRGDEKVKLHSRLPCHRSNCVLQVLQALLDVDCSVNSKQAQGNMPLMVAISKIKGIAVDLLKEFTTK